MASLPWILMLALVTPLAGCASHDPAQPDNAVEQTSTSAAQVQAVTSASTAPRAPGPKDACPTNVSNYGTTVSLGTYEFSLQSDGLTVYKESNGQSGIQTPQQCPWNPDTTVAHFDPVNSQQSPSTSATGCSGAHNAHGSLWFETGGQAYEVTPHHVAWYVESNGLSGIQNLDDCPQGHDLAVGYADLEP